MERKDFYFKNREVGKLVQFAYDLHKRGFSEYPNIPTFSIYDDGKKYKDGGIWGKVWFCGHENVVATISLFVTKKIDKNYQNSGKILGFQTRINDYELTFSRYTLYKEEHKYGLSLKFDETFDNLTFEEEVDEFIDYMEYLGFIREDIIDVINHKLTAREAYQHVAPQKYKDRS